MRYKEYNPNRVLEQAMDLFWERSFYGCSVNDIVERTGVNRFSLYHEFDNKEGILYASLNLYLERYARPRMEILDQNAPVNETLEAFLESYFTNESRIKGCYFIHVGTEMADFDATIRSMLKAYLNDIQTKLYDLLIRSPYSEAEALFFSRHLLGLFIKVMSFCLVHPPPGKENIHSTRNPICFI